MFRSRKLDMEMPPDSLEVGGFKKSVDSRPKSIVLEMDLGQERKIFYKSS